MPGFETPFKVSKSLVIAAFLICCGFLIFQMYFFNVTWDDAYISYRYSKNFANGSGLVYNPGEYVEGYTTFIWVLLLGILAKTGFDIPQSSRALCLIFAIGTLWLTYLSALRIKPNHRAAAVLALLFLSFRIDYGLHFQSGMETSLNTFFIVVTFYLYLKKPFGSHWLTGICAALLSLIRPEAILITPALMVNEYLDHKQSQKAGTLKDILALLLPVILIVGAHVIWRYGYYGDLLPNTFYTKTPSTSLLKYIRGSWYLAKFFIYGGGFLYYIPLFVFLAAFYKRSEVRLLRLFLIAYMIFNVYASGDWSPYTRFMIPALPIIAIGSAYGIIFLLNKVEINKLVWAIVIAVFLISGYQNGLSMKVDPTYFVFRHNKQIERWKKLCEHFRMLKKIHPDLTIAANAIGTVGYYSEAKIIDMLGLTNRHIAKEGMQLYRVPGHERWDMAYVMSLKPDIIYPGSTLTLEDGSQIPNLGKYTSEEIYQMVEDNYEMVVLYDIGDYWIRRDFHFDSINKPSP